LERDFNTARDHCLCNLLDSVAGWAEELLLQANSEKLRAGADVFVARRLLLRKCVSQFNLDISSGSRHDAGMKMLIQQFHQVFFAKKPAAKP